MKCKVDSTKLKAAIKTVVAVHAFGSGAQDDRMPCVLRVVDGGDAGGTYLLVEGAKLGACVTCKIPCTALRAGTFGLSAKDLSAWKMSGKATLDANKGRIKLSAGRSKYEAAEEQSAVQDFEEHRGAVAKAQGLVKMPLSMLRNAAKAATFKSELSKDFDVQIKVRPGFFQFCGVDHLSFGRFQVKDASIQAKSDNVILVLGNSFLQDVLKNAAGDEVILGTNEDGSVMLLKTESLLLFHPTVDRDYVDPELMVANTTANPDTQNFSFTATRASMTKATAAVAAVGKKAEMATSVLVIKGKKVLLKSTTTGMSAEHHVDVKDLVAAADCTAPVRHQYLAEFVKAAPSSAPLKVTAWDDRILHLMVETDNDEMVIDYMGMMQATS